MTLASSRSALAVQPAPPKITVEHGFVTFPSSGVPDDRRSQYYISLLQLALDKADSGLLTRESPIASVNLRTFERMATGNGIDVVWAPTTNQLERDYLPIRVPLDKGVLGWRIFLVNRADRDKFASVKSLDDLRKLSAGQAGEWVDTQILRYNGLRVVESTLYENLFRMLSGKRFDYFPRGIAEISGEAANYEHLGLVVEPHLALHYPFCTYFFVARSNPALANLIELGLRRAQKDGSMESLFQQFNGMTVAAAKLGERRVFELENPTVPPSDTPAQLECRAASAAVGKGH
ncbi:hypothetical protein ACFJGW_01420 [Burkholderiaceae bacterium UC74_6]